MHVGIFGRSWLVRTVITSYLPYMNGLPPLANWEGRQQVINYCVDVVDKAMEEREKVLEGQEAGLDAERTRSKLYSDQVKVLKIICILTIAVFNPWQPSGINYTTNSRSNPLYDAGLGKVNVTLIPQNSCISHYLYLALAFTSRCRHFEPPRSDVEARRWWDAAIASR